MSINDKRKTLIIIGWSLVAFWMVVIFMFSAQNSTESSELSGTISDSVHEIVVDTFPDSNVTEETIEITTRNIAHFVLYFVLGFLVVHALNYHNLKRLHASSLAVIISILYSVSDEWHQTFVPGRGFEMKDLIIDFFGIVIGVGIFMFIILIKNRKTVLE